MNMETALPDDPAVLKKEIKRLNRELMEARNKLTRLHEREQFRDRLTTAIRTEQTQQEKYLNMLLENSHNIIILLNKEMRFAYCTRQFLECAGIADFALIKEELVSSVFEQFFDKGIARRVLERIDHSIAEDLTIVDRETLTPKGDSAPRIYKTFFSVMRENKDGMDGFMMLFSDITDIQTAREEAETANRAKSDFLAKMSHEIRTPMNVIMGMSELMRTDNLDDVQKRYFSDIRYMSNFLLQLVNNILDFSKIEAQKMEIAPVHFDIYALFDTIRSINLFIAGGKSLEFYADIDRSLPAVLYGDETRIRQVLTNIVNNAVKYTHHGFIRFLLKRATLNGKEYLSALVEDSGIGIKKEDIPNLFGMFQQFDTHRNQSVTGAGLGLAITKNLLDLMGGFIEVESEYGKGSRFTVYITLVEGNAEILAKSMKRAAQVIVKPDANINILVVDDIAVNLTVALGFLRTHNIVADTAESGASAIALIQEKARQGRDYDLIFMDHMMPDMDGIETMRRIRALDKGRYAKVPIAALSANAVSGMRETFINAGMNDFIAKPINAEQLNDILAKWLPPESFSFAADNLAPLFETISYADDPLFSSLESLEGLDVKEGLLHTGGEKAEYYRVLRQFCLNFDKSIAAIENGVEKEKWDDYVIWTHGIKGILRTIGQQRLGEWAYKLEMAGKEKDFDLCRKETPGFCEELLKFRADLENTGLLEEYADKTEIDNATLGTLLDSLKNACAHFDADKMEEAIASLRRVSLDAETDSFVRRICDTAEMFDYKEAMELIESFKERT